MITFKVYRYGNKTNGIQCTDKYGTVRLTADEVIEEIRSNPNQDVVFIDRGRTREPDSLLTYRKLMSLIKHLELKKDSNLSKNLLNKIIRKGGFTKYIASLKEGIRTI